MIEKNIHFEILKKSKNKVSSLFLKNFLENERLEMISDFEIKENFEKSKCIPSSIFYFILELIHNLKIYILNHFVFFIFIFLSILFIFYFSSYLFKKIVRSVYI